MRIVCPSCAAAYDVPDSLLIAGRAVRCARCNGEWSPVAAVALQPEPPPTADAAPPPADTPTAPVAAPTQETDGPPVAATVQPRPTAMDRLAAHPAVSPPRYGLRVAWAASFALLALLACGAYTWRSDIVHAWPPSARMYAAFGLHADTIRTQ